MQCTRSITSTLARPAILGAITCSSCIMPSQTITTVPSLSPHKTVVVCLEVVLAPYTCCKERSTSHLGDQ